jgi:hypothetical protein
MPGRFRLEPFMSGMHSAQGCDAVAALFVFSEGPCIRALTCMTGVQAWVWLPVVPR